MTSRLPTLAAAALLLAACSTSDHQPFEPEPAPRPLLNPGANNASPSLTITAPANGAVVGLSAPVTVTATFTDPDAADTHTCSIDWQFALTSGTVTESGGSGSCTGSFTFPATGDYAIGVSIIDNFGNTATGTVAVTVAAGSPAPAPSSLHGEGVIDVARGSYPMRPEAAGTIGFHLKAWRTDGGRLRHAITVRLKAAERVFVADELDRFEVTGGEAELSGTGRMGGRARYRFVISVVDGDVPGGDGVDRFRVVITNERETIVDTELGAARQGATNALTHGRIVLGR